LSVLIKNLNPRIETLDSKQAAFGIERDRMYYAFAWLNSRYETKFARLRTRNTADDLDELAIFCEFHNPAIAISIRDEDIAIGCNGHIIRTIEKIVRIVIAGDAFLTERHE